MTTGRFSSPSKPNIQNISLNTELGKEVRRVFLGGQMRTTYPLEAFTLDRKRVWILNVFFEKGSYRPESDIINLRGPISYYVADITSHGEEEVGYPLFCIDAMGRNFGTTFGTSVYVYLNKIQGIVEEHQKSLIR